MEQIEEIIQVKRGLYDPKFEHDNCGIGAIVNIKGKKTHDTVKRALDIVCNLEHRAGKDGEGKTGDGVAVLIILRNNLKANFLAADTGKGVLPSTNLEPRTISGKFPSESGVVSSL